MAEELKQEEKTTGSPKMVNLNEDSKTHEHNQSEFEKLQKKQQNLSKTEKDS